jgi:hypothetical protein
MSHVRINLQGGLGTTKTNRLLGLLLIGVALACVLLLLLGLWILLAFGMVALAIVGFLRALLPRGQARKSRVETHTIFEGRASTLRDVDDLDDMKDVGEKHGASPPSTYRKPQ